MLDIITVKPRPRGYHAVQFTGKNGKVIAAWINEETRAKLGVLNFPVAVARGSYVNIETRYPDVWTKAGKNAWVVLDPEGEVDVYTDTEFNLVYKPSKK